MDEARAMVAEAEAAGRVLKCGFNHRHHPAVQQARRWFEEGRIGEPVFIRARYGIGGRPGYEREWRADPEIVSGGQLMEQGIHAVDLARWFLGEFGWGRRVHPLQPDPVEEPLLLRALRM
jgi:predicted dehydrogenase